MGNYKSSRITNTVDDDGGLHFCLQGLLPRRRLHSRRNRIKRRGAAGMKFATDGAKKSKPPIPRNITVTVLSPALQQRRSPIPKCLTPQTVDSTTGSDMDEDHHLDDMDMDVLSYSSLSSGLSLNTDDGNELKLSFCPTATNNHFTYDLSGGQGQGQGRPEPQIVYDLSGNGPWNKSN